MSRPWSTTRAAIAAAMILILLMPCTHVLGQVPTAVLRAGDPLAGAQFGDVIVSFDNTSVNHAGGYAVLVITVDDMGVETSHAWGTAGINQPTVLRSEGLFDGLLQVDWEFFLALDDAGSVCYSANLDNGFDSIWLDDVPLLVEEDELTGLPPLFSTFSSRPGITGDGQPWWIGGLSETQGGSKETRALFFGTDATRILESGDTVSGLTIVPGPGISFDTRFSETGTNYITQVRLNTGSSLDDDAVVINGQIATVGANPVREDQLVPGAFGGLPGERWDNFDAVGITENGDWMLTGDTNADPTLDEFVLVNGEIALREGDVLTRDGLDYTLSGFIKGAYMNASGDWVVTWDVDTPGEINVEALIFNGSLVLLEGDPVDWDGNGQPDANARLSSFSGIRLQGTRVVVSDRVDSGLNIYFSAMIEIDGKKGEPPTISEGFFQLGSSAVAMSEIRTDGAGADPDVNEYFELTGVPGTTLSGITYIVIGDGPGGGGVIETVVDLSGSVIPADGTFLAVESMHTLAPVIERNLTLPAAGDQLNFEDGDNVTHAIVFGFTGAFHDDLDIDDDGELDTTPWAFVIDAVGLRDTNQFGEPLYGEALGFVDVGPDGSSAPGHVYRCLPTLEWTIGPLDETSGLDTPGVINATCDAGCPDPVSVQFNEIRIDQCDGDSDEYIEIRGPAGTSLDSLCIVIIGNDPFNPGSCGLVQSRIDLSGTIPGNGHFLIASDDDTFGAEPDMETFLQLDNNEQLTFYLVCGCGSIAPFQDLDTNDDGALDSEPWTVVIDSIAVVGIDPAATCVYGPNLIGPALDQSVPEHLYRCEPGGQWGTGFMDPVIDEDTPGALNTDCFAPCFEDLNGNAVVDFADILTLLGTWGPCPGCSCPADLSGNGRVDFADVLDLLGAWGPCP